MQPSTEIVNIAIIILNHKATKSDILSRGPPNVCHHFGQTLTIDHMFLKSAVLEECDEYYTADSLDTLFDVSINGTDLYLLKPTLGPPKIFRHLTRAEEVVIIRLRIGHTKATKSHILSRGPQTACQLCGQTLTIEHILMECTVLQQSRHEYNTVDSLRTLFETIPEACIIEFLREAGFYYLIWMAI